MTSFDAVSLFSNCGAGDLGYQKAGFTFAVLAELVDFRLEVAQLNHPDAWGIEGDLRETLPDVIKCWHDLKSGQQPDLLSACPPCQGMSSARGGRGLITDPKAGSRDPRNLLVEVVALAVKELRPKIVVVENVAMFLTRQVHHPRTKKAVSAAAFLVEELLPDYVVYPMVSDLADFGIPQSRKRSFLTFVRRDSTIVERLGGEHLIPYPIPTHENAHINLASALNDMNLPELDASTRELARDPERDLHQVPVWSKEAYRMVAAIPANSGKTAWQNNLCPSCGTSESTGEMARCPKCRELLLRPIVMDESGEYRLIKGFKNSSYSRMHPDRPAATITTASGRVGSDNTIHPSENRLLSLLECSVLQTFPDDFDWGETLSMRGTTHLRGMIGEAVPPKFTASHGAVLRTLLEGRTSEGMMTERDMRCIRACAVLKRVMGSDAAFEHLSPSAVRA